MKEFIVVLAVLRSAQNRKNNEFSFLIRKINPYFELLPVKAVFEKAHSVNYNYFGSVIRNMKEIFLLFLWFWAQPKTIRT